MLPMRPDQIARRTHEYKRNGTSNLYAAFHILTGQVLGRTTKRHRAREFLDFLPQIDRAVPTELALHVILDKSSTHKTADVMQWLKDHPRCTFHCAPTSASWLNAVGPGLVNWSADPSTGGYSRVSRISEMRFTVSLRAQQEVGQTIHLDKKRNSDP